MICGNTNFKWRDDRRNDGDRERRRSLSPFLICRGEGAATRRLVWTHPFGISLRFWKTVHSTLLLSQHLHHLFSSILIWFVWGKKKKSPVIWAIITLKSRSLETKLLAPFYRYCKPPSMWSLRSIWLPQGFEGHEWDNCVDYRELSLQYSANKDPRSNKPQPLPHPVALTCLNSRHKEKTCFLPLDQIIYIL